MFGRITLITVALAAITAATEVNQCPGKSFEDLSNNVQLIACNKPPCKLKKGTSQQITVRFVPGTDLKSVKNHVLANVLGVPLPFVGVDGYSICDKVYLESGDKASCPLKAGTTYVYKDSFPVLSFYPAISVKVHWSLQQAGKDITCFEVPAKIVS